MPPRGVAASTRPSDDSDEDHQPLPSNDEHSTATKKPNLLDRNPTYKPGPILFCPLDGHMLVFEERTSDTTKVNRYGWFCHVCGYHFSDPKGLELPVTLTPKSVDDVLGGEDAWKNVAKTEATCPKCNHHEAFFREVQTRSADEPATIFYLCCNNACQHQWKEN